MAADQSPGASTWWRRRNEPVINIVSSLRGASGQYPDPAPHSLPVERPSSENNTITTIYYYFY